MFLDNVYYQSAQQTGMFLKGICASGSVGGARPCQGRGRGFESRLALFLIFSRHIFVGFFVSALIFPLCMYYMFGEVGRSRNAYSSTCCHRYSVRRHISRLHFCYTESLYIFSFLSASSFAFAKKSFEHFFTMSQCFTVKSLIMSTTQFSQCSPVSLSTFSS